MKKLYDLIHSLSQGEKRYVKIRLNANKSGSLLNTYFDKVAKQKNYSFDDLRNVGKRTNKLTQSNLSLLYDVILKHLRSHYSDKNLEYGLRGDLSIVKILMDKGFFTDAKSHCKKLIHKAISNEEFEVLKSAYKEYWNLHLLNGELNDETNLAIQSELNIVNQKEAEILSLEELYRKVTTLYYNYFFKKRDEKYQKLIKQTTAILEKPSLLSDKSKHIFFEIKSIESVVFNDLESHHNYRKQQLKHLIKSPVFETENLLRLMVLSNTFTFLKSKALVKELRAYINFMEKYFLREMENGSDSVFTEKYFDIYFSNQSFLQAWDPNREQLLSLLELFKNVISKGYLSNTLLVGRIYLSLIELLIVIENYKATGPLLTEFFNASKKKKYSKHYLEGDLLYLLENYLQGKMDTFDNAIESFKRKIRRNEIVLDPDQQALLELLNDLFKECAQEPAYYLNKVGNKQTYKLFVYKLLNDQSFDEIRKKHFPINDLDYDSEKDAYLQSLNQQLHADSLLKDVLI